MGDYFGSVCYNYGILLLCVIVTVILVVVGTNNSLELTVFQALF